MRGNTLLVGAVLSVVGGYVFAQCRAPNPNLVGCVVLPGWVLDCTQASPRHCDGLQQAQINLFPDGVIATYPPGRYTTNEAASCFKSAPCSVNTNRTPPRCENMNGFGPWILGQKTIATGTCVEAL
jgi:hypothetical protein